MRKCTPRPTNSTKLPFLSPIFFLSGGSTVFKKRLLAVCVRVHEEQIKGTEHEKMTDLLFIGSSAVALVFVSMFQENLVTSWECDLLTLCSKRRADALFDPSHTPTIFFHVPYESLRKNRSTARMNRRKNASDDRKKGNIDKNACALLWQPFAAYLIALIWQFRHWSGTQASVSFDSDSDPSCVRVWVCFESTFSNQEIDQHVLSGKRWSEWESEREREREGKRRREKALTRQKAPRSLSETWKRERIWTCGQIVSDPMPEIATIPVLDSIGCIPVQTTRNEIRLLVRSVPLSFISPKPPWIYVIFENVSFSLKCCHNKTMFWKLYSHSSSLIKTIRKIYCILHMCVCTIYIGLT